MIMLKSIRVDLINHCNAQCWFCPYHGSHGSVTNPAHKRKEPHSYLKLSDFELLVDELLKVREFPKIKFSGRGEATIHPDFGDIVELLSGSGFCVRLITNGINLMQFVTLLERCAVATVVSIHGPEQIHDEIVGVRGAYQKAEMAACMLKSSGVDVSIASVVTPKLLPHLPSFVEEWREMGFSVRMQHDFRAWHSEEISLRALHGSLKVISQMPGVTFLPNLSGDLLDAYYLQHNPLVLNPHECSRILKEIDISSDGTIYTCRSAPFGNMRDGNILRALLGSNRAQFVQEIKHETSSTLGLNPLSCDRCCYQTPPML